MAPAMEAVAELMVAVLTSYAAFGLAFGLLFVVIGIHRVDAQAKGASIGFRLIILPGVAAMWPLLLARWVRGVREPPLEANAHRSTATNGGPS
jgi:hypothetical protein